jgi:hypothetical protein
MQTPRTLTHPHAHIPLPRSERATAQSSYRQQEGDAHADAAPLTRVTSQRGQPSPVSPRVIRVQPSPEEGARRGSEASLSAVVLTDPPQRTRPKAGGAAAAASPLSLSRRPPSYSTFENSAMQQESPADGDVRMHFPQKTLEAPEGSIAPAAAEGEGASPEPTRKKKVGRIGSSTKHRDEHRTVHPTPHDHPTPHVNFARNE